MKTLMAAASLAVFASIGMGADKPLAWPQFRGPGGSGVADGQKPPVEFGPDKNVKWKVPVPSGFSSPIVAGDNLILTAFDKGKLFTIAYRRADGKEMWRSEAPAKAIEPYHKSEGSPAASTPATDGKRIVSYFGSCGLFCYDLAGKQLWKLPMPRVSTKNDFGTGVSPIIVDGIVVLQRDETTSPKIVAVDVITGKVLWEKPRRSLSSYCTPVAWHTPAGKQIVAAGYGRMIGYDLKTGEEKWSVAGMPAACCATPVVADGTLFFAAWSPGDPDDKDFKMPAFDDLLKLAGEEKLGHLTKAGAAKTPLKDFFDNNDTNKDGKITRAEWDEAMKYMAESKKQRLCAEGRRERRGDKAPDPLEADKGFALCPLRPGVRGAVPHGKGRRPGHRLRREDWQRTLPSEAVDRAGSLLRLPGGSQRAHLFHVPGQWSSDGAKSRRCDARGRGSQPKTRGARGGNPGYRG